MRPIIAALAIALCVSCTNGNSTKQYLPIGSPCAKDSPTTSNCGTIDEFFCDSDHPNGYCKASCHKDIDCPSGSVCAGAGLVSPGECHKSCTQATAPADCRLSEGYVCKAMPDDASHDYCDIPEAASDGGSGDEGVKDGGHG